MGCIPGETMEEQDCSLRNKSTIWYFTLHLGVRCQGSEAFKRLYGLLNFAEAEQYITIYQAIRILNFMTCVKFVPWDGKAKDYLLIWPVKYPSG